MKVKSCFQDVDQLIARIQAANAKTKPDKQSLELLVPTSACHNEMGKLDKCCLALCK